MLILLGEILMAAGAVYFCMVLLSARNPNKKESWWNKSWMYDSVHVFILLSCWVVGPSLLIKGILGLDSAAESGIHAAGFLVLLGCTVFLIKKLHVKERLAEFDTSKLETADVIAMPAKTGSGDDTDTPANLKKAA